MQLHQVHERRRGGAGLAVLAGLLLFVVVIGGCGVSQYNGIVSAEEQTQASWGEIDNQYKRRFDLIPQLVETVKGAANFEKEVLTEVTEARASVAKLELPSEMPTDPAQIDAILKAQQGLGSALSRLFAVSERYPELKATAGFRDLQSQLEGTENRIAVARRDYIDSVKDYNSKIRKFPGNLVASSFGFDKLTQPAAEEAEREVPKVDFSDRE
ncbi:MAG: LemA family protein [bacterium]|nr:LemA family protein [bacterium]